MFILLFGNCEEAMLLVGNMVDLIRQKEGWPELDFWIHKFNRRISLYDYLTKAPENFAEARDALVLVVVGKYDDLEEDSCYGRGCHQMAYLAMLSGAAQAWLQLKGYPLHLTRRLVRSYLFCRTEADLYRVRDLSISAILLTTTEVTERYLSIGRTEMRKFCSKKSAEELDEPPTTALL